MFGDEPVRHRASTLVFRATPRILLGRLQIFPAGQSSFLGLAQVGSHRIPARVLPRGFLES